MKHYQNYIFDLYGTLIDIWTDEEDPNLWRSLAELYSRFGADYTPEALKVAYRRIVAEELDETRVRLGVSYADIPLERVFLRLYREAPVRHKAALSLRGKKEHELWLQTVANCFRSLSMRRFRLYPGVKDVLTVIRSRGCGIYLLSNAQHVFTVPELEMAGISDYFDAIYISSDHGMAKPEGAFLDKLLQEQKLERSDCVLVGNDWSSDMAVAARCGVDGIFLNSGRYQEAQIRAGLPKGRFQVVMSGAIGDILA